MAEQPDSNIEPQVRPLREDELPDADRVCRLAYGTFLGLPDPMTFFGDADYVRTRWLADPNSTVGAEVNGELIGCSFATRWGSFGFFGPLAVRPDMWDKGIAKRLLEKTMELFDKWKTNHAALFTFANSEKHIGLYQKFGFWPQYLTAVMSKPVQQGKQVPGWSRFSDLQKKEKAKCLDACSEVTSSFYNGLDLRREIRAVEAQKLGETILLWNRQRLAGFAVCHCGAGSEAGSGNCYVKFGAVRAGTNATSHFESLIDACEALAFTHKIPRLVGGMNTGRHRAYRAMIQRGFRIDFLGVTMQRPNEPGYNRPDVFVIDDLR